MCPSVWQDSIVPNRRSHALLPGALLIMLEYIEGKNVLPALCTTASCWKSQLCSPMGSFWRSTKVSGCCYDASQDGTARWQFWASDTVGLLILGTGLLSLEHDLGACKAVPSLQDECRGCSQIIDFV